MNPEDVPEPGRIGDIVDRLLPQVNDGLDWDFIKQKFDPEPEGTAIGLWFWDDEVSEDQPPREVVVLVVGEGPSLQMLNYQEAVDRAQDPEFEYKGDIYTLQSVGLKALNPNHDMTPEKARWQHGAVTVRASNPTQRELVWTIGAAIMGVVSDEITENLEAE